MSPLFLVAGTGLIAGMMNALAGLGPIDAVPLRSLVTVIFIGGAIGAALLLRTPIRIFDVVLPWLMAIATVALALGSRLGEMLRRRHHDDVWSLLSSRTLRSFNAPRTLMVCAANAIAVLIFVAARAVYWREALVMLVTAMLGAYCGSLIGRRAPTGVIRVTTMVVSVGITLGFFVRAYLK